MTPRKDPSEFVLELDKMGVTTLNSIFGEHNNTPQCTCARCGAKMVVRTNNFDGSKFYGCSNYPRCIYVLNIEIPYSDDESEKQSSQVSNKYKDTDTVSTFKMPLIDEKVVLSKKESALHRLVSNKQEKKTLAEIYASNEGSIKEAILAKISTKKKTSTKRKKARSVTVKAKTNKKTSKVKITKQKRTISKSRKRSL